MRLLFLLEHYSVHFIVFLNHALNDFVDLLALQLVLAASFFTKSLVGLNLSLDVSFVGFKLLQGLGLLLALILLGYFIATQILHVHVCLVLL